MILRGIVYLLLFGGGLAAVLWWLASYSTDITQTNGMPAWTPGGFLQAIFSPRSRDTTVSAYARQVHEHDRLLDEQAEAAMSTAKPRPDVTERELTQTEERTGG